MGYGSSWGPATGPESGAVAHRRKTPPPAGMTASRSGNFSPSAAAGFSLDNRVSIQNMDASRKKHDGAQSSEEPTEQLLATYGAALGRYTGEGAMTFAGGATAPCEFEAGQLGDGSVLLLCSFPISAITHQPLSPIGFSGVSTDDTRILAAGDFFETNYLPDLSSGQPGLYAAFHVRELHAIRSTGAVRHVRFGVTNFDFVGTNAKDGALVLPLALDTPAGPVSLHVAPRPDMHRLTRRLKTLRSVEVTCEIVVESVSSMEQIEQLRQTCDDLVYVLSVARGTKIQWIYMDAYDECGARLSRLHRDAVTKPYSPLPPLDPRLEHRDATRRFIEGGYRAFVSTTSSHRLTRAMIDSYVDARLQTDYLEMRGVKTAIVIEMLKWISAGKGAKHPNLKASLAKLSKSIGLRAKRRALDALEASRNHLVHEGYFYCQVTPEPRKYAGLSSPWREYTFLVNFVDVLFLKLLGYNDSYLDWHGSDTPTLRSSVTLDHWTA